MKLNVTREADDDLFGIFIHHSPFGFEVAQRLVDGIIDSFDKLIRFPEIGRARPELGPLLRSFPTGKYLIIYRVLDEEIQIVRVLHQAQDIGAIFDEE
ncbi:MAG: type II toxin-antitoxin system RelE/ParE family toxin [Blastocatellia bacterium]